MTPDELSEIAERLKEIRERAERFTEEIAYYEAGGIVQGQGRDILSLSEIGVDIKPVVSEDVPFLLAEIERLSSQASEERERDLLEPSYEALRAAKYCLFRDLGDERDDDIVRAAIIAANRVILGSKP